MPGPRYRLGQYAIERGELEKARAYLASEIKLASDDADVLVSMASMFLAIAEAASEGDDKDKALDNGANCLLRAIDIDPCIADAYYYLGVANGMKGELEDAAEFFTHALDINPQHVLAIRDAAAVCLAMHRPAEAAKIIDKGILAAGDNPQLKDIRRKIRRSQFTQQLAGLFGKSKQ